MSNNHETKSGRFKRLAEKRTRRILNEIRILSNLSNKGLYEYTPDQLKKIFGAIKDALSIAEARFRGDEKHEIEFKL